MTYRHNNKDPNLNNLHHAMDYNSNGEPIIRVLCESSGGGMDLTALSVTTITASNGGSLTYNNTNGVFTYSPADLSNLALTTYVDTAINNVKDRIVSPNDLYRTVIDNTGTTTFGGDIVPGASTYTLGTVALPWKDIYVSQGSIIIADTDPAVDGVNISNTNKYIVIDRGGLKVTADDGLHEIFQLDNTGKLILKSEQPLYTTTSAVDLIGNLLGTTLPTNNLGVMLHATGTQDQPSRIYLDGVGTQGSGASAYAAFIGRYARGTVESPLPAEAGDILARFGGNAWSQTLGLNTISNVRVDMIATEQQTDTGRGSRLEFWTTPIGSVVPQRSVHVDSQGIDLSEATDINAGVTFKDGSLLKYWPSITGNAGKVLRTDGATFYWDHETVTSGLVIFKGDWSAANPPGGGTPTISDASGELGWQWIVSAAGTQDLGSGNITFAVGDLVIHNGTRYVNIPANVAQVQSDWTETNTALPAYIKHKPTLATVATSGSYLDLSNRPSIPAAQVNSDWNATSGLGQILNKPTIPTQYTDTLARAAISLTSNTPSGTTSTLTYVGGVFTFTSAAAPASQIQSDWNQSNNASLDFIKNKPTLFSGAYADLTGKPTLFSGSYTDLTNKPALFSGSYTDLSNKPTIPAAQIQSDWTQTNVASLDYIKNKPTLTNGTVTSVSGTGTVSGLTLTGSVTSSGSLTLGGTLSGITNSNLSGTAGISNANLANSTISGVALGGSLYNLTAGTGISFSSGTTYNGSAAITINSTPTGIDDFTSLVTTQITTLAVDMTTGPTMIFWQPSANGNRAITLSNFTAGRRVKIFITPHANNNTFTFTGVTASQCSNGSITYVLGGGGVAQSSMMIEVFSTTTAIGGVWIFGFGSQ